MPAEPTDLLRVPPDRAEPLRAVLARLRAARKVVLTTHLNADGDGSGSEAALAAWLEARGIGATIVNPTPFPASLRFLLHREDVVADLGSDEAAQALRSADLFLVLDTSEANRVAPLVEHLDPERTIVVDHHPPGPSVVGTLNVQETGAAATGELVFDLLTLAGGPWPEAAALGIYVAIVSDTGSFRFSNTTPRTHAIAADLLRRGVDPETVFERLFGTFPLRRMELLREALATLRVEPGLSWMVVPHAVAERLGVTAEDFEGLIDHARSVEDTRIALLFREMPDGETKVSLRSNGKADVNRIARAFGGGGHVKAAGASFPAAPAEAVPAVLAKARAALREEL
jgi:bifunctional oligoribonuclease and PAP phosphatase NrnA